jgi:hypothetical protein
VGGSDGFTGTARPGEPRTSKEVEEPDDNLEIDLLPESCGDDNIGSGEGKVEGGAGLNGLS